MTRVRLREPYSPEQLAKLYARPYKHGEWADHVARVDCTIALLNASTPEGGWGSAVDLSCGDGAILHGLNARTKTYGDYAPGYEICGPIEETVGLISPCDLFICSETLEHLEDPDAVLARIRERATYLCLSTPIGENDDRNPEHYWGWGVEDIRQMLAAAHFRTMVARIDLTFGFTEYDYQIWIVR